MMSSGSGEEETSREQNQVNSNEKAERGEEEEYDMKAILKWKGLVNGNPSGVTFPSNSDFKDGQKRIKKEVTLSKRIEDDESGFSEKDPRETDETKNKETKDLPPSSTSSEDDDHIVIDEDYDEEEQHRPQHRLIQDDPLESTDNGVSDHESDVAIPQQQQQHNQVMSENCKWCKKWPEDFGTSFEIKTPDGHSFCTETCFDAFRRAAFKKNKCCDWCRKSSSTLMTFTEKESQMQFCNESCLAQFKMDLFCRETAAAAAATSAPALKRLLAAQQNGQIDVSASLAAMASAELWLARHHRQQNEKSEEHHSENNKRTTRLAASAAVTPAQKRKVDKKQSGNNSLCSDEESIRRKHVKLQVKPDHLLKVTNNLSHSRSSSSTSSSQKRERSSTSSSVPTARKLNPRHTSNSSPNNNNCNGRTKSPLNVQLPRPPNLFAPPPPPPLPTSVLLQHQRNSILHEFGLRHNLAPFLNGLSAPPPLTPAPSPTQPRGVGPPILPQQQNNNNNMFLNNSLFPHPTLICPLPMFIPLPIPIPLLVPVPEHKYMKDFNSNFEKPTKKDELVERKEESSSSKCDSLDLTVNKRNKEPIRSALTQQSPVQSSRVWVKKENDEVDEEFREEVDDEKQVLVPPRPSSCSSGGEDASSEQRRRRRALIMDVPSSKVLNKRQRDS